MFVSAYKNGLAPASPALPQSARRAPRLPFPAPRKQEILAATDEAATPPADESHAPTGIAPNSRRPKAWQDLPAKELQHLPRKIGRFTGRLHRGELIPGIYTEFLLPLTVVAFFSEAWGPPSLRRSKSARISSRKAPISSLSATSCAESATSAASLPAASALGRSQNPGDSGSPPGQPCNDSGNSSAKLRMKITSMPVPMISKSELAPHRSSTISNANHT